MSTFSHAEVLDYGYPQKTDSGVLKTYITQQGIRTTVSGCGQYITHNNNVIFAEYWGTEADYKSSYRSNQLEKRGNQISEERAVSWCFREC